MNPVGLTGVTVVGVGNGLDSGGRVRVIGGSSVAMVAARVATAIGPLVPKCPSGRPAVT